MEHLSTVSHKAVWIHSMRDRYLRCHSSSTSQTWKYQGHLLKARDTRQATTTCFRRRKWARDSAKLLRAHLCKFLKEPADSLPVCQFPQQQHHQLSFGTAAEIFDYPRLFLITLSNATVCLGQSADTSFLVSSEIIHATGLNTVNGKYLSLTFCLSITICCPMTWAFIVELIHSGIVSPWLKDSKGLGEKNKVLFPNFKGKTW